MEKGKVDKTKDNIGVAKLDEKTRKNLFTKFVESGGKVVEEKPAGRRLTIDREKQKQYIRKVEPRLSNKRIKKDKSSPIIETRRVVVKKVAAEEDASGFSLFVDRMKIRFKLKFLGIAGFNGYYFNNRFFKKFNNLYKPALMDVQILFLDIFRKNPAVGRKITAKLDSIKPLYFELIEMTGNLFDKIIADQIVEQYVNFPQLPKKTLELKEQILSLYKKLYVLNTFENSILAAFERAIDYYAKAGDSSGDSHYAMTRRVRNNIFVIFHKFLPRLHVLFCMYQWRYYELYDTDIESVLGIGEADKPGNRQLAKYFDDMAAVSQEEGDTPAEAEDAVEDETDRERLKAIRQGLELMSTLDTAQLRKEYDRQRHFETMSDGDKVLITYLLFNEFDREYSFILTTNKIKFRTDFVAREKVDFRQRLNALYDKMRVSSDSLLEYAREIEDYEKSKREKPSNSSQYIEFTKRLEVLENKKKNLGKNAMAIVRNYMNDISQELKLLLDDMNSHQIYIENPQEELVFDPVIEGEKKINGKKIYEAVYIIYCYVMAFAYRLSQEGDLSGDLEFRKEELAQMKDQSKEQDTTVKESPDKQSDKSVLEELDDMI
ncbi:MAG TPA: hypothetical protein PLM53_10905 [Spirochaetota bacterium]|nr:hypothetical protein [Spirochaetota bacterium]HPC39362.1 hypothetical protein [Spirochaetota bacterium]HPL15169.1 hypothetical protein [Spirochaetota bacterium]HQF08700.1 hypothetical protein [Spirochaetota bacterium]HQH97599.1 hypothetical protein [Spirochaetota bacterium]